jgi:hypothetical protein
VFLPVVILFCLDQQNTKLLVKTEQDHNWKEHNVVGQDRNKITTGRNKKLSVKTEQDHNWKEHKVVGQDRTISLKMSLLEGTQSQL